MKLWLQVLFVQGWLWRDRFPDKFAEASVEYRGLSSYAFLILPAALLGVSLKPLADGKTWAIAVAFMAGIWLLWSLSSRGLRADARHKELRISMNWAMGFLFCVSVFAVLAMAIATADWQLIPVPLALIVCWANGWLRGIQRSYLHFRDPDWMPDEPPQTPRSFVTSYADFIADTYWRLPKQILCPQRERHAR
jgi:hypothetical protein